MSEYSPEQNYADMQLLKEIAIKAGEIGLKYFNSDLKSWRKDGDSPVSEADIAIDNFLNKQLLSARPSYGWMSEESADNSERLEKTRVFIVDPIDGTRGFINGDDSWTISLAVVENGAAVVGVVYAPVRDELYCAALGHGAFCNDGQLKSQDYSYSQKTLPAYKPVINELEAMGIEVKQGQQYPSLAYRLVQVAAGNLYAGMARKGAHDWDIAGADIIISESGMSLFDACNGKPTYNKKSTRHGPLGVCRDIEFASHLKQALVKVYGCA